MPILHVRNLPERVYTDLQRRVGSKLFLLEPSAGRLLYEPVGQDGILSTSWQAASLPYIPPENH